MRHVTNFGKTAPLRPLFFALFLLALAGMAFASVFGAASASAAETTMVYAIGNINGFLQFPLLAFIVDGDELIPAETLWLDMDINGGPVGLLADSANGRLYIASHHSNTLATVDMRSFEPLGASSLTDASDLAGMDIDAANGLLYVVNREGREVFVYHANDLTLADAWMLTGGGGAFGVTVRDGVLYVGDGTDTVNYYNVADHSLIGSYQAPEGAIAANMSPLARNFTAFCRMSSKITRYDMATGETAQVDIGAPAEGLRVNPDNELVYILSGFGALDQTGVTVVDGMNMQVLNFYSIGDGTWSPTDTALGQTDFGRTISLAPVGSANSKAAKGDIISFTLKVANTFDTAIHVLPLDLLFNQDVLEFVSADPATDGVKENGYIGWNNLVATMGYDLSPDATFTATLNFRVRAQGTSGQSLIVKATGVSDEMGELLSDTAGRVTYHIESGVGTGDDDAEPTPAPASKSSGGNDDENKGGGCGF